MRHLRLASGSRNAGFVAAVSDLALIIIGSLGSADHWNGLGGCDVVAGIPLQVHQTPSRSISRRSAFGVTIGSVRTLGDYGTETWETNYKSFLRIQRAALSISGNIVLSLKDILSRSFTIFLFA